VADPCVDLEEDLIDCIEQRDADLSRNRTGYILRVTGLDLFADFLTQDQLDKLLSLILGLFWAQNLREAAKKLYKFLKRILGGIAANPTIPEKVKKSVLRKIGKLLGRLIGFLGLAILVYELIDGYQKWSKADDETNRIFNECIAELYRNSDCETKDAVFIKNGLSIPS
jgi:hypothetical protein